MERVLKIPETEELREKVNKLQKIVEYLPQVDVNYHTAMAKYYKNFVKLEELAQEKIEDIELKKEAIEKEMNAQEITEEYENNKYAQRLQECENEIAQITQAIHALESSRILIREEMEANKFSSMIDTVTSDLISIGEKLEGLAEWTDSITWGYKNGKN